MIKTYTIDEGYELTSEQLQEIKNAKRYPIVTDEDCPELSPEMYKAFKREIALRNQKKARLSVQ